MSYQRLSSKSKVETYQKVYKNCSQRCCFFRHFLSEPELESLNHLRVRVRVPFDKTKLSHLEKLKDLWQAYFTEQEFPSDLTSSQWKLLGFQGIDPSTDFRGAGVFGIDQLVYLSKNYPHEFKAMVQAAKNYSFAISALNISHMLMSFFQLHKLTPAGSVTQVLPVHLLKAFCHLNMQSPDCIHEIFVAAVIKMHDTWVDMNKTKRLNVMMFQSAILSAGEFVISLLESQPQSLNELKKLSFS